MVKPSDPEATPRRDGWLERKGTWGEVTVGSLIAGRNRTDVWEVIATSTGAEIQHGYTLWFRVQNQKTGALHSLEPRDKLAPVTFLMKDDSERPPPYTPPFDSDEIALLVEKLGATPLAQRDNETGEIVCPNYDLNIIPGDRYGAQYLDHMRVCHGMDVSGLEKLTGDDRTVALTTAHSAAHKPGYKHTGGFPHRHLPEER